MAGKLYGLGVGPGDPELLTLKALRMIQESDVIAVPGRVPQETIAYKIVVQAYPELAEKRAASNRDADDERRGSSGEEPPGGGG